MSTWQGNHFDEFHLWIENEISTLNHFIRFKFIYNSQDLHINLCELYNVVSDIIIIMCMTDIVFFVIFCTLYNLRLVECMHQ